MAATTPRDYDRWLWLGIGISLVLGPIIVSRQIAHITSFLLPAKITPSSTSVDPPEHLSKAAMSFPEDAIQLSVLSTLVTSTNYDIRVAAERIVKQRYITSSMFLDDLRAAPAAPTHAERQSFRHLLDLLAHDGLWDPSCLSEAQIDERTALSQIMYPARPQSENAVSLEAYIMARRDAAREHRHEGADDEARTRLRRREAMVIADGDDTPHIV